MKKQIVCTLALMLTLAACSGSTPPPANSGSIFNANGYDIKMNPPMPLPEYPIIDGSSSTAVMHTAIRAYLTDEHFPVEHSQTYAALERLLPSSDNQADVVLAVKYYDETLQDAKGRGADLVITPVAKEGFIFVLHKSNPVNSLTQEQLRGIYSGKITNWAQVGGRDEEIIPFVRNWASGSQTAMTDFMGGEPILGENESLFAAGMMILLTSVQENPAGIGYNILSWSTGQNLDAMGLKAAAVDGIQPNNRTLADSSYPLMVYTYSYYNSDNEKGKNLTDWLLTAEGQKVIASADYVGLFGEMPPDVIPDLYKDDTNAMRLIEEYYTQNGFSYDDGYLHSVLQTDREQTTALAGGKEKDVTALYLVHIHEFIKEREYTRFIVLTRERGGEFEIINEGAHLP
jgi:ABC-type phosphate transport system substrate-binding protein